MLKYQLNNFPDFRLKMVNKTGKRGGPPLDSNTVKRNREDIELSEMRGVKDYLTEDEIAKLSQYQQIESEKIVVKKRKSSLHCKYCDNKFPSKESLMRHNELKSLNVGRQDVLPRAFKKNGSQIIVCRSSKCCYSTKSIYEIYKHDKIVHNSENFSGTLNNFNNPNQGGFLSVINIIDNIDEPSINTCGKCLKNFVSPKTLTNHKPHCSGKQIFSCSICKDGFNNHEDMVGHVYKRHRVDTSFKSTGVFIGVSRKQKVNNHCNKKKLLNSKVGCVYEKTYVPIKGGLRHTRQVLTPQIKSQLVNFLSQETNTNNLLRFHLVLEAVISKPDGDFTKRSRWTTRSVSEVISTDSKFFDIVEKARVNLQRNLNILHATPSGITFSSIIYSYNDQNTCNL